MTRYRSWSPDMGKSKEEYEAGIRERNERWKSGRGSSRGFASRYFKGDGESKAEQLAERRGSRMAGDKDVSTGGGGEQESQGQSRRERRRLRRERRRRRMARVERRKRRRERRIERRKRRMARATERDRNRGSGSEDSRIKRTDDRIVSDEIKKPVGGPGVKHLDDKGGRGRPRGMNEAERKIELKKKWVEKRYNEGSGIRPGGRIFSSDIRSAQDERDRGRRTRDDARTFLRRYRK